MCPPGRVSTYSDVQGSANQQTSFSGRDDECVAHKLPFSEQIIKKFRGPSILQLNIEGLTVRNNTTVGYMRGKIILLICFCFIFVLFAIFILHSRESELYRYTLDGMSALAWELPFLRFMGHLSST